MERSEHKLYDRTYPDECTKIFWRLAPKNFSASYESGYN
jgi:hypothetical protein